MRQTFRSLAITAALAFASSAHASGAGTDWATKVLNHSYRTTAYTQLTNVFVALGTGTAPTTDAGAVTAITTQEVAPSSTSYQRVSVARADASWAAPSASGGGMMISNAGALTFPAPTGNWCSGATYCTWMAIMDAQCTSATVCGNGNMLAWGALTQNKNVNSGDAAPSFAIGALTITLASLDVLDLGYALAAADVPYYVPGMHIVAANDPMAVAAAG